MNDAPSARKPPSFAIFAVLLALALALCAAAYAPGLGGSYLYDDEHNLGGLAYVHDLTSALDFALLGNAGPLGRPVSLLSFAAQAYAWPASPEVFLYTNIAIHLLNGCLLALLLSLLGRARGLNANRSALVALASATLWMLLPIQASSSLMIVQRMTLLAGTFSLAGLCAYLHFRLRLNKRPLPALAGMTISLGLATLLAALAKENGALLPALTLVIEITLLARPANLNARLWLGWRISVLGAPALIVLAYLIMRLDYNEATVAMRGYTADERILTQAHILWAYLFNSFIPNPALLGPFHDHQTIYHDWLSPLSIAAVGGWLLIIAAAIRFRRKAPLFSFAVLWYLISHSLESSSIPLELYFEHRNYLPLLGPIYALMAAVAGLQAQWRAYVATAMCAYMLLLAAVLYSVTSTWGNPALAAEMWAIHNPDSPRALSYLVQQLQRDSYNKAALRALERFLEAHPEAGGTRMQALTLSCIARDEGVTPEQVATMDTQLKTMRFQHGIIGQLEKIRSMILEGRCESLAPEVVYRFASSLADNPNYQANAVTHHNLHIIMAMTGFDTRNLALTMRHLEQALELQFNLDTVTLIVNTLRSAGLSEQAAAVIAKAEARRPSNPLQARTWDRQLALLNHSPAPPRPRSDEAALLEPSVYE